MFCLDPADSSVPRPSTWAGTAVRMCERGQWTSTVSRHSPLPSSGSVDREVEAFSMSGVITGRRTGLPTTLPCLQHQRTKGSSIFLEYSAESFIGGRSIHPPSP